MNGELCFAVAVWRKERKRKKKERGTKKEKKKEGKWTQCAVFISRTVGMYGSALPLVLSGTPSVSPCLVVLAKRRALGSGNNIYLLRIRRIW